MTQAFGRCISAVTSALKQAIPAPAFRRMALTLAAFAALAACQPASPAVPSGAQTIRTSAEAAPGTAPISIDRARAVFSSLCIAGLGSRTTTEKAAAEGGFVKSASTGTYYHPRDNLSVKLIDGDCSMVFASNAPERDLEAALTSLTAGSPPVLFGPGRQFGADTYFNVRIAAQ
jgi:hypothetical protein